MPEHITTLRLLDFMVSSYKHELFAKWECLHILIFLFFFFKSLSPVPVCLSVIVWLVSVWYCPFSTSKCCLLCSGHLFPLIPVWGWSCSYFHFLMAGLRCENAPSLLVPGYWLRAHNKNNKQLEAWDFPDTVFSVRKGTATAVRSSWCGMSGQQWVASCCVMK